MSHPAIGVTEFFRPGEHGRVERVLEGMRELGVEHLRTLVSWADWHADGGRDWYAWLLSRLAREVEILPSVFYTPPSIAVEPRSAAPPRRPRDYADFLDVLLDAHGEHFEWVGLWNEPNNLNNWDWRLDPGWEAFAAMIAAAGNWVRERGHRALLGGMCPTDPNWLSLMADRGVLEHVDAIGIHGFPGTWEYDWESWSVPLGKVRRVLEDKGMVRPLWITEAGYSTWRHDEYRQLLEFARLLDLPVERAYWYAAEDLDPDLPTEDGHHTDERHYHMGLRSTDGAPKLLARLWARGGIPAVRRATTLDGPGPVGSSSRRTDGRSNVRGNGRVNGVRIARETVRETVLVTGGAGFIGTNLADRLASDGRRVTVLDNLSRPGVERNLRWLIERHGSLVRPEIVDLRDRHAVRPLVERADRVFHFAGQAAVTASLVQPRQDFEINASGTLNVLEAARRLENPPPIVFTSTNKVYGALEGLEVSRKDDRYVPRDATVRERGIDENKSLDFRSPYGCSKGTADQYVLDYARTFSLPALVFRMSCIYGPHQHGTEDQGWVAHFLVRAIRGEPIRIFGDGLQVRDILYVDDLVEALLGASRRSDALAGRAFNVGGGPDNAVSLLDVLHLIGELREAPPVVEFDDWRPGDQRYYVSDTTALREAIGWKPQVDVRHGVSRLHEWLAARHDAPTGAGRLHRARDPRQRTGALDASAMGAG